jgi:NAD(P)-dependent dehydrogenase (short-subunit alcohol dehydrogenase family)
VVTGAAGGMGQALARHFEIIGCDGGNRLRVWRM